MQENRIYYLPSGEPVVVGNMGRGYTIGELETHRTEGDPYNVRALTPVTLCRISAELLKVLVKRDPSSLRFSLAASEKAARCLSRQIWVMNAQRVYDRLVRMLMVLCNLGLEKKDGVTTIGISHDDLAFLIHTDRISITRCLYRLAMEKLVALEYKHIQVTNALFDRFEDQGYLEMFASEKLAA